MKSVFISHSSKDKALADVIVYSLEQEGISVWIAPRDIPGGSNYGASIAKGLKECEVLVLVFSKTSNESDAVFREVQIAFEQKKAIIPFRIDDVQVSNDLSFYLSGLHWIDGVQKRKNVDILLKDVKGILQNLRREFQEMPPRPVSAYTSAPAPEPLPEHLRDHGLRYRHKKPTKKNGKMTMALFAASLFVVGLIIGILYLTGNGENQTPIAQLPPDEGEHAPDLQFELVAIPTNLVGATYTSARAVLESLGFAVVIESVHHDEVSSGIVIAQNPSRGLLQSSESVTLYVSLGRDMDVATPVNPAPNIMDLVEVSLGERFQTNLATGPDGRAAMVNAKVILGLDGNAEPKELESLIASFNARLGMARSAIIHEFGNVYFDEVNSPDGQFALAESMSRALQEQFETNIYIRVFFSDWNVQRGR